MKYSIGIDFGTESGRVLIVNVYSGEIVETYVSPYKNKVIQGKLFGKEIPSSYFLQNSLDYLEVIKIGIPTALKKAKINPLDIVGIGIDFTSSTVIVTDEQFEPLHLKSKHKNNPHAYVKLWKHHGAIKEAKEIRNAAIDSMDDYLGTYGFNVSSEWMIPKILELKNNDPEILNEASYIMEAGDWIVAKLINENIRSNCFRGFKTFWNEVDGFNWVFYKKVDSHLPKIIHNKVDGRLVKIGDRAGLLSKEMSDILGLPAGIPVASPIIDAHSSVIGVGAIRENDLTMIMGTSSCHILLHKEERKIPGISGVVKNAILPELYAYEAGQPAVGDLFQHVVSQVPTLYEKEAKKKNISIFDLLESKAATNHVGKTGLICLDWYNGNRSLLSDNQLSGLIVGQQLDTKTEDIYRALMESTAFGTKKIINRYEEYGMEIKNVIACGGLPKRSNLLMEIYANVLNKPIIISDSEYASGMGAAILGAVAGGAHNTIEEAVKNMKLPILKTIYPKNKDVESYKALFSLYQELHDYFGIDNKHIMHTLNKLKLLNK